MANLSISKAWDEASAFLRREARLVAPVALAAFVVPSTVVQWMEPRGAAAPSTSAGTALLLMFVTLLFAFVGQMTIAALVTGWRGSVGEALAAAFRRVWGVFAAIVIIFLPIALVGGLAAGLALIAAGISDPAAVTPEALAKLPQVGAVLLILSLVMLVIWVRLFPMPAVAINEGANPLKLMARSWALTRGHLWRLLATVLLIMIASIVLGWAVTMVVGAVVTLTLGPALPFSASALIIALFAAIAGAIVSAVGAALVGRIYAQLSAGEASVPEVSREG